MSFYGNKKACLNCEKETTGRCGDDPVCFDCYRNGAFAEYLRSVGRGDELVDSSDPLK